MSLNLFQKLVNSNFLFWHFQLLHYGLCEFIYFLKMFNSCCLRIDHIEQKADTWNVYSKHRYDDFDLSSMSVT